MTEQSKVPEINKLTSAIGIVVMDGDKVLSVRHGIDSRHKLGINGIPAGQIEEDETPKEAAVRELEEETGLITNQEYLLAFPGNHFTELIEMRDQSENVEWTVFLCTQFSGELRPEGRTGEQTIPHWVGIKEFSLYYDTMPNVSEAIYNAQKFLNSQNV